MKLQYILCILIVFLASTGFCEDACHPLCECYPKNGYYTCGSHRKDTNITDATLQKISKALDPTKVKVLNFIRNNMEAFNVQYFANFTNLISLHIQMNSLTKVPERLCDILPNLTHFSITRGKITGSLTKKAFKGCQNMTFIGLNRNQINAIEPGTFEDAKSLQKLRLDENNIKTLKNGAFRGATKLEEINLGRNEIQDIEAGAYKDIQNLERLDLDRNQLKTLKSGTFSKHIGRLVITNNLLTNDRISDHTFNVTSILYHYNKDLNTLRKDWFITTNICW